MKIKEDIIKEKAKKEGVYRRFNVSSFPQADVPNFDQKKLFEEEENNLKKDLESEKNKKENMKKIVDYNKNMRENLINKTSNPLEKKKFADIASKISSEVKINMIFFFKSNQSLFFVFFRNYISKI